MSGRMTRTSRKKYSHKTKSAGTSTKKSRSYFPLVAGSLVTLGVMGVLGSLVYWKTPTQSPVQPTQPIQSTQSFQSTQPTESIQPPVQSSVLTLAPTAVPTAVPIKSTVNINDYIGVVIGMFASQPDILDAIESSNIPTHKQKYLLNQIIRDNTGNTENYKDIFGYYVRENYVPNDKNIAKEFVEIFGIKNLFMFKFDNIVSNCPDKNCVDNVDAGNKSNRNKVHILRPNNSNVQNSIFWSLHSVPSHNYHNNKIKNYTMSDLPKFLLVENVYVHNKHKPFSNNFVISIGNKKHTYDLVSYIMSRTDNGIIHDSVNNINTATGRVTTWIYFVKTTNNTFTRIGDYKSITGTTNYILGLYKLQKF